MTNHIGAGHAGVTVTVSRASDGDTERESIAETKTGQFGDFVVKVGEPMHGEFIVHFRAEGYAELERQVQIATDDEFPPYLAEMLPGKYVVVGRVIDVSGEEAVVGASVKLSAAYNEWHDDTDADGQFTFKGVLPGRGELIVEADGFGRERQTVARLEDFGEIVIGLRPHRVIQLEVVNDKSEPIGGATVELLDAPRDDFRTTITDENGRTTIKGIHFNAALIELRLTHEDHVSSEQFDREIVTPVGETQSTHKLVMTRAGGISGRITSAESGEPLGGARVLTGDADASNRPRDWSNYQGKYTVNSVRAGPAVVTIHRAGYAPELRTVDVVAGNTTKLDVALGLAESLQGVIKDENGKPVPNALVETSTWRNHTTLDLRARSGEDGRFVIDDAPRDEFEIVVRSPLRGTALVTRNVSAGNDRQIQITVPAAELEAPAGAGLVNVGDTAPIIGLTTLSGVKLDLKELRGKTVLLDFWATWCAPCIAELPHLKAVYDKFALRSDFVMIGISLDGDKASFSKFVKERKLGWHQVVGLAGGAQKAADRYGVTAVPAVFVVSPEGKVIGRDWHGEDLVTKIEQVLKDNDPT